MQDNFEADAFYSWTPYATVFSNRLLDPLYFWSFFHILPPTLTDGTDLHAEAAL